MRISTPTEIEQVAWEDSSALIVLGPDLATVEKVLAVAR